MAEREPIRENYDAVIDIAGRPPRHECVAYVLIKFSFRINSVRRTLELAEALPLENDIREDDLDPRIPAHTDFWSEKQWTDVGLIGSAYAPGGKPVQQMTASVDIGGRTKDIAVFGDREVEWTSGGQARAGSPEPFTEMPLTIDRAYGGCDFRVPIAEDDPQIESALIKADFPGLYPRNPWGTGYLAVPDPIEGIRLPNLENPRDLLVDDRLIVKDPALWYTQPLAWHLDWLPISCFPRNIFLAIECEPWYEAPDDTRLPEVKLGILPQKYRKVLEEQTFGTPPHWRFRQEASHGLSFAKEPLGAEVQLAGVHPEHATLAFRLPRKHPRVEMTIERTKESLQPHLVSVALYPDQERVALTYTAAMTTPRPFVPGIHKHIPIAVSINGDRPVEYEAPPTVKERLDEAQSKEKQ